MKAVSKTILAVYLLILLWLLLFKSSFDLLMVFDYHRRSLNLIPFDRNGYSEMICNVIIFVPLGLLLSINFGQISVWRKLAFIFVFSLVIEIIQFVTAIGVADLTDVITNTGGGLIGLVLYAWSKTYVYDEKLDRYILYIISTLLIVFLLLRTFIFKVRY